LLGGEEGATNFSRIERNGREEDLPGKFSHLLVRPGETVTFLTAGGGGYGPAAERDPEAVERDLEMGYVTNGREE
jgi:N-methylhydantoinase B